MNARDMARLARRLIEDHHAVEEAAEVLGWACEVDPDDAELARLLVRTLVQAGKYDEARAAAERLPEDDAPSLHARALALSATYDQQGAIDCLDRALERTPDAEVLLANRGLARFHDGQWDEAARDLVRAGLVAWGMSRFSALPWGPVEAELADFRPILKGFKRIRSEAGERPAFALVDAWACLVKGKPRLAKSKLAAFPETDRASWAALALEAICARERDRKKSYLALLRKARAAAPRELPVLIALRRLPQIPEEELRKLVFEIAECAPRWARGQSDLAELRLDERDLDGALAAIGRALELEEGSLAALGIRARVLRRLGRTQEALGDLDVIVFAFTRGLERASDRLERAEAKVALASAHVDRGRARVEARDLEGALADFERAIELAKPRDELFVLERARFFALQKKRKEALRDLDYVVSRWSDARVFAMRMRLREKTGDRKGAAEDRAELERLRRPEKSS